MNQHVAGPMEPEWIGMVTWLWWILNLACTKSVQGQETKHSCYQGKKVMQQSTGNRLSLGLVCMIISIHNRYIILSIFVPAAPRAMLQGRRAP